MTSTADVRFQIDLASTQTLETSGSDAVPKSEIEPQGIVQLVLQNVELRVYQDASELPLRFDSSGNIDEVLGDSVVQLYNGSVLDVTLKLPVNHTYTFDLSVTSPDDVDPTFPEAAFARETILITGPTTIGFPSLRSLVQATNLNAGGTEITANSTRGIYLGVTGPGSASPGVAPTVPYSDFSVSYAATGATVDVHSRRGVVITHDGASASVSVTATVNAAGADRIFQDFITVLNLAVVEETADVSVIVDLQPPTVSITNVLAGATFTAGVSTTISGTATDSGLLAAVTLYDDLIEVGNASLSQPSVSTPDLWDWSISWTPTTVGIRELYAVARDSSGNQTVHTITVEVVEAPALVWYQDADADGYGDPNVSATGSTPPSGYVSDNTDCDDANGSIHPGAPEVADGVDNDCDLLVDEDVGTTWYQDADGDGYGNPSVSTTASMPPANYVADSSDCDDSDPTINPDATETLGDTIDNDCDGVID